MILDLTALNHELQNADIEEGLQTVYLGTIHALTPSGKVCAPWVDHRSDVEAQSDEDWYEEIDRELDSIGAWLEHGENDPCDLFAVRAAQ